MKQATRLWVACGVGRQRLQLQTDGDGDDRTDVRSEGAKMSRQVGDDRHNHPQGVAGQRSIHLCPRVCRAVRGQEVVEFLQVDDEFVDRHRVSGRIGGGGIDEVAQANITNSLRRHRGVQHICCRSAGHNGPRGLG